MKVIPIDPDAVLEYFCEWQRWLAPFGDSLDTSAWLISPDTLARGLETRTETRATIELSGAQAGQVYLVTNHIETAAGRKDDRSIYLVGRER